MIKVLIVDDSKTVQENLRYILNSDDEIEVIGVCNNGAEVLEFLEKQTPDIITMDVMMPIMNGFEATQSIMEKSPVPVVIISASNSADEVDKSFKAFEAGALALIEKPYGFPGLDKQEIVDLIKTVKAMSKVKLVKRWRKDKYKSKDEYSKPTEIHQSQVDHDIVAIGASTGGPPALLALLKELPANFPLPIVIVQHIAQGFINGMVDWLDTECSLNVSIPQNGELLKPNNVYLAPDGHHIGVDKTKRIFLYKGESEFSIIPSVSYLFDSVAKNYGAKAIAILLTGMGSDGAKELKTLYDSGALTIIQDEKSSVVFGMPGVAKRLGAARIELNPVEIGKALVKLCVKVNYDN